MTDLTGKQRRHLRALGQRLAPTLHVGHGGVTEAVVGQTDAQLEAHELIKVRVSPNAAVDCHDVAEELARRTSAHLAQAVGRMVLLYRRRQEDPAIVLPGEDGA